MDLSIKNYVCRRIVLASLHFKFTVGHHLVCQGVSKHTVLSCAGKILWENNEKKKEKKTLTAATVFLIVSARPVDAL